MDEVVIVCSLDYLRFDSCAEEVDWWCANCGWSKVGALLEHVVAKHFGGIPAETLFDEIPDVGYPVSWLGRKPYPIYYTTSWRAEKQRIN